MSAEQTKPDAYLIRCPQCGKHSPSIKVFHYPIVIFLIVFIYGFRRTVVACPACQRGTMRFYALLNLPAMNLLWPFICLPVMAYFFVVSLIPGHSRDVHDILQLRK